MLVLRHLIDRWLWVLDLAFVHNPIGMALFTLDGRFMRANPAFCALLGVEEVELLERQKARGIGLALDDLGVGYSSLAHLHRLPVDVVKLAPAFPASVPAAGSDSMAGVVELCGALELRVIAEEVESYEQHQVVRSMGITWAQGYFYAEPSGAAAVATLLAGQPAPPEHEAPGSGAVAAPT